MVSKLPVVGLVRSVLLENLGLKFVALVLALTVYILVHSRQDEVAGKSVTVSYRLPEDKVLVSDRLDELRVTVQGSARQIKRLGTIEPLSVDLRDFAGEVYKFNPDQVRLPSGLKALSVEPETMPVRFEAQVKRRVPVLAKIVGTPMPGYGVATLAAQRLECETECDTVLIRGAQSAVVQTAHVETAPVSVAGRSSSFAIEARVLPPHPLVMVVDEPRVRMQVAIVEQLTTRHLDEIAVSIRSASGVSGGVNARRFTTEPAVVSVLLRGAKLAVEKLDAAKVTAFVDVYADDVVMTAGKRQAAVLVEGTPRGVAIEVLPRAVTLLRSPR